MEEKKDKPDNIVYDYENKKYDAYLKKYPTNLGAPAIDYKDISNWKNTGISNVNNRLKSDFEEIKQKYEAMLQLYEWNEIIYGSTFNFEPIVGHVYHLYENKEKNIFLSTISPDQWDKKCLGSFRLNQDRIFEKV